MANCNNSGHGSEQELQKQKQIFSQILMTFLKGYPQARSRPFPVFVAEGKRVDLYDLSARVRVLGGYQAVTVKGMWGAVAVNLGLEPSSGPILKLVFAKYLKLAERWLPKLRAANNNGEIVTFQQPPRSGGVEANNDVLVGTLKWIKCVAASPGRGLRGWSYEEKWAEECFKRAETARLLVFNGADHQQYSQKKQKIHPTHDKEPAEAKSQGFEIQMTNEMPVPVNDFHQQAQCPSSCVASPLLGVHTQCGMASSIPMDQHMQQYSQKLPSILNVTAGYGFSCIEHNSRKRVRLGPEFQADIPVWNGLPKQSQTQTINEVSSFNQNMDDSRWLPRPIWPMKDREGVVNEERIGKGRSDSCSCSVQGSIECVRLHVEEEREKLREESGVAFSSWRFDDMGESVSKSWSSEEERKFWALVRLNPASLEKNFWNYLPTCLPSKKIEDLVSYYFNVFVLRRRGIQNRVTPDNIDSDDDESEVGSVDNANLQVVKGPGTKSKMCMPRINYSGNDSSDGVCCINTQNCGLKRFRKGGESTLRLPHLEDHNCVDVQKQLGVASLSYNMEYLRSLQEKDFHGAITVEKL